MSGILYPGKLYPSATVGGCIDIFENAWPNPEETIAMVESACADPESGINWERAGTIGQGAIFQTHGKAHDLQVKVSELLVYLAKPGGTNGYPAQPGLIHLSVCHSVCL